MYQTLEVKTWASKGYEEREPDWEKRDALRLSQRETNEGQREERDKYLVSKKKKK